MPKNSKRLPPALKYGIYSGLSLLPTESRTKFRKFKKQTFADPGLSGPLEEDIGDVIVRLEWRQNNLFTYDLGKHARDLNSSIYSKWVPSQWHLPGPPLFEPEQQTCSAEELAALRKRAEKEIRIRLGSAIELVQIGDVVTYEYLEKELAIREKLRQTPCRLYHLLIHSLP
jgi:hypothetical protein